MSLHAIAVVITELFRFLFAVGFVVEFSAAPCHTENRASRSRRLHGCTETGRADASHSALSRVAHQRGKL